MSPVLLLLIATLSPELEPPAPGQATPVVTEQAFLDAVGPEHPAWRSLEEAVAEADAEVRRAAVLPNPVLGFAREAPSGLPSENTWLLTWRPPLDGRRGPTRNAAEAGARAARADLAARRLRVRRELRRVYADWAVAAARLAVVESHGERIERAAEVLRQRAETGEVSGLAARRITLSAEGVRAARARAEAQHARVVAEVKGLWPEVPNGYRPELPPFGIDPTSTDVSRRPDLVALEEQVEQADLQVKAAGRFWGFPEVGFGWQTLRGGGGSKVDGPVFAASWSVPLFDRDQGRRARAEGRARVLAARHRLVRARARAEMEGARAAWNALRSAALRAAEAAQDGQAVVRGTAAAFEAGEADVTDLNDALRAAFNADLQALELRREALAAEHAFEVALGRPLTTGGVR
jgi:cobalt-zinc-cadmium efflux system outer membrane protein